MCSHRAHADAVAMGNGTGQPQPRPLDVAWRVVSGVALQRRAQRLGIRGWGDTLVTVRTPCVQPCGEGRPAGRAAGDRGAWPRLWVQPPPWHWAGTRRGGWKHH